MRSVLLPLLCLALAACQHWTPGGDWTRGPDEAAATAEIPSPIPSVQLPFQFDNRSPSLSQWLDYQLYVTSLSQPQKEELWRHLEPVEAGETDDRRLMRAVLGLSYPARRRLNDIAATLDRLANEPELNLDSRRYAGLLQIWVEQLRRQDGEILRLRQQLAQERARKQELEEKIRKLSDIEETLNLRQRD